MSVSPFGPMKYVSPSPGNGPLVNFVRMGGKYLPRRLLFDGRERRGLVVVIVESVDSEKAWKIWIVDVYRSYRWYFVECERTKEVRLSRERGSRLATGKKPSQTHLPMMRSHRCCYCCRCCCYPRLRLNICCRHLAPPILIPGTWLETKETQTCDQPRQHGPGQ